MVHTNQTSSYCSGCFDLVNLVELHEAPVEFEVVAGCCCEEKRAEPGL